MEISVFKWIHSEPLWVLIFLSGLGKAVGSVDSRSPTDTPVNGLIPKLFLLYIKLFSTITDFVPNLSFPYAIFPYCPFFNVFLTITLSLMTTQLLLRLSGCVELNLVFLNWILSFLKSAFLEQSSGEVPRGYSLELFLWYGKLSGWQECFFQEKIPPKNLIFLGQVWKMIP